GTQAWPGGRLRSHRASSPGCQIDQIGEVMTSIKKLATAALLALGLLALFAGPASAMKYSLNIAHPEGLSLGTLNAGGMASDSAGNLYVPEQAKIEKFDSSGKYLSSFPATGQTGTVKDVDIDSSGNIWVISARMLTKYNATGTLLKSISLTEEAFADATAPTGITYAAEWGMSWGYDTNGTLT